MRVSVALTSWNRDRFLTEALDSALAQATSFDFEIVVGDDASGPQTREILLAYEARFAGKVRLLLHPRNLGLAKNFAAILGACRGEFVALLDDDDLWTSTEKLQRQVDLLERHPEYSMCFHDSRHFHQDGGGPDYFAPLPRRTERYGFGDLRAGGFIPTSSTMLRRALVSPLPDWFLGLRSHEWSLHLLSAGHGDVGFLDELLSATRIHPGGKWNGKTALQQLEQVVHNTSVLEANLRGMRHAATDARLSRAYFEMAREYRGVRDFDRAALWTWRSLRKRFAHPAVPFSQRLGLLLDSMAHALDARLRFRRA